MANKDEKSDAKAEPDAAAPAGAGKKKMILFVVGALLLVGGAVGGTLFFVGGGNQEVAEVVEEEPVKDDPSYIDIKPPFTVNLAPDDPVGFLQVSLQVLTHNDDVASDLKKHKPLIRNNLVALFGQQKSADLRASEGKQLLQQKVLENVQSVIDTHGSGGEVTNVFFTSFVMQ